MEQFNRITTDMTRVNSELRIWNLRIFVRRVLKRWPYRDQAELKRESPELEGKLSDSNKERLYPPERVFLFSIGSIGILRFRIIHLWLTAFI